MLPRSEHTLEANQEAPSIWLSVSSRTRSRLSSAPNSSLSSADWPMDGIRSSFRMGRWRLVRWATLQSRSDYGSHRDPNKYAAQTRLVRENRSRQSFSGPVRRSDTAVPQFAAGLLFQPACKSSAKPDLGQVGAMSVPGWHRSGHWP